MIVIKAFIFSIGLLCIASPTFGNDIPVDIQFSLDELEYRWQDGSDPVAWSGVVTASKGSQSINLVSEGDHTFGDLNGHEVLLYYASDINANATINIGWRRNRSPAPSKDWALMGFDVSLPGDIAVSGAGFFSTDNDSAFRLEIEKTLFFNNNRFFTPQVRADFYGQNSPATGTGAGLSTLEAAMRLGHQWSESYATYLGVIWGKSFGTSADYLSAESEDITMSSFLIGFNATF